MPKLEFLLLKSIHDQFILPVLTHEAEMMGFYKEILHKLQMAQRANGTKLVRVTLREHKRNTWARGQNKVSNITKRKLKWEWVTHYSRTKALGAKQR